jgi:hypothetical protein
MFDGLLIFQEEETGSSPLDAWEGHMASALFFSTAILSLRKLNLLQVNLITGIY